jgi:outer membrane receptor protein involved in Fe transport
MFLSAVGVSNLQAQMDKGVLSGTATDATGAVVAGAKIDAKNVNTGVVYTGVTGAEGRYLISELIPGTYEVTASKSGFEKEVQTGLVVTVGARPVMDFKLKVGGTSETVEVKAQTTQVETQSTAVGMLVSQTQMEALPLNGRNFADLMQLAPGVTWINQTASATVSGQRYGIQNNYAVSGSRPVGQAYMLDNEDIRGAEDHGAGSAAAGTTLGMDSIQEFTVLTNTYSAEYGGTGAAINAVTKSGTNAFHGSIYEYYRDAAFNALPYSTILYGGAQEQGKQNQFGVSLGGPIKKNKMFFFANYEGLREGIPAVAGDTWVPDMRQTVNGQANPNYFWSNQSYTGQTYTPAWVEANTPGWTSTANGQHYTVLDLLNLYPASNCNYTGTGAQPAGMSYYCSNQLTSINENMALGRIDYTLGTKDTIFGRVQRDYALRTAPIGSFSAWHENDDTKNWNGSLEWHHTLSATVLNEARIGFVRSYEDNENAGGSPVLAMAQGRDNPNIIMPSGLGELGGSLQDPYQLAQNRFNFGDDLRMTIGKHNLSFGGNFTRIQSNIVTGFYTAGWWFFYTMNDFFNQYSWFYYGTTAAGYNYHGIPWSDTRYWRQVQFEPYVQDDWKVGRSLTLNLGVRYAWASNPTTVGEPVFVVNNPLTDPVTTASNQFKRNPNRWDIDPRVGLAWDPFKDHKTSVRSAFGMFHEPVASRTYQYSLNPQEPMASVMDYVASPAATYPNGYFAPPVYMPVCNTCTYKYPATSTLAAPFPTQPTTGISQLSWVQAINNDVNNAPYQMQYNLTVQRQLPKGLIASLGYNGSTGVHMFSQKNINLPETCGQNLAACQAANTAFTDNGQAVNTYPYGPGFPVPVLTGKSGYGTAGPNGTGPAGSLNNPFIGQLTNPNFGAMDALEPISHSTYNSLQSSLTRMFSKNLTGNVAFTYSKCIDSGSSSTYNEQGGYAITNPYNQAEDRGLCSFNVPIALRVNGVYSLPKINNLPYKLSTVTNGWQIAPIFTRNSGMPFDIVTGMGSTVEEMNTAGGFVDQDRPLQIPGCKVILGGLGPNSNYWNPNCFVLAPFGTDEHYYTGGGLMPVGRNAFTGPSTWTFDMSLQKETKLTERISMTFRADAFNLLNHPIWQIGRSSVFGTAANPVSPATATYGQYYSLTSIQNPASFVAGVYNATTKQVTTAPGPLCGVINYTAGVATGVTNGGACYGTINTTYDGTLPRELQLSVRFTF